MYHLYVARPAGFSLEAPDIGTQLLKLGHTIGFHNGRAKKDEQVRLSVDHYCRHRIHVARNMAVDEARRYGATHLLFIDPDICIDHWLGSQPWAKPWWETYWPRAKEELGVFAAPYAGMLQPPLVQVFDEGAHPLPRVTWESAAARAGWQRVRAVGTGLMLIPMRVFNRVEVPYFDDVFTDERKTKLKYSQDIYFCDRCWDANIPIYVNWDCWCGHWQNQIVGCPRQRRIAPPIERPEGCVELAANQELAAPWA